MNDLHDSSSFVPSPVS